MLPWLNLAREQWIDLIGRGRIPSSTLITSRGGLGDERLLHTMAQLLLCQGNTGCTSCHSCCLMRSKSHPDFHLLLPEKKRGVITVNQTREIIRRSVESSYLGGHRVIGICPAEAMNESASNSILKVLEEPPEKCFFLLVSRDICALPPTIISRCHKCSLSVPPTRYTLDWLKTEGIDFAACYHVKLNGFAPLETLRFFKTGQDKVFTELESMFVIFLSQPRLQMVPFCAKIRNETLASLSWLWFSLADAEKRHFGLSGEDFTPLSEDIAGKLSYPLLRKQRIALSKLRYQLSSTAALNEELLVINWLLKFIEDLCL